MTEIAEPVSPGAARRDALVLLRDFARTVRRPALLAIAAVAVGGLVFATLGASDTRVRWSRQLLLPLATLGLVCAVGVRHELHWTRPMRRLRQLLPMIRAGEAPIEELSHLRGGAAQLVPQIQELLHDLRQQKVELAELNEEVRLRVQQRTDALERTIGSLRQQATRDALTGLYNRRMLDGSLPSILDSCRADGSDLAVLVIDVDYFKHLNDTLGHAAGDELLRDIGQLIRSTVRARDIAFRQGGDEFTIVMPGAGPDAADALAKRLISLVDARAKTLKLSPRPRLSIGTAQLSQTPALNAVQLLQEADKKLYDVKSARKSVTASRAIIAARTPE
jgi:diguanylate cyclase (GGDEF)-like protein